MRRHLYHISVAVGALLILILPWQTIAAAPPEDAPELWFPVGEELTYKLYWNIVPVGKVWISCEWIERDGKRLLSIRSRAKSNKVIATIYPIDDFIESIIDPEGFLPVEFTKKQNEGRFSCDEKTVFDREHLVARLTGEQTRKGRHKVTDKEYAIEPDTRDIVSFLYYVRKYDFKVGHEKEYRVMTGEKIYDIHVEALKAKRIKAKRFGKVECLEYVPGAALEKVFVTKGKLWLWVSRDARRIIVKAKAKGRLFSSVKAVLVDVRGPGDDFWVADARRREGPPQEPDAADPGSSLPPDARTSQ